MICPLYIVTYNKSLPLRERGLKYEGGIPAKLRFMSLPLRERGLKSTPAPIAPPIFRRSLYGSVD